MTCETVRPQLTAYLDGELEDERGSAVRGHLRGCVACRTAAEEEAALRDGLRSLPPVDPPASLWSGVQARLAAAEIADAERPAWRAALARWFSPQTLMPRLPIAGIAVAAVVLVYAWRSHHAVDEVDVKLAVTPEQPIARVPAPVPSASERQLTLPNMPATDVSVELAALPAAQTHGYAEAADELWKLADEARPSWSDERKQTFDARVADLHSKIDRADEGAPRQRAYRALIRYLQGVAIRDEVAVNDRTFAGGVK
jgi:hypothetical protein